MSGHEDNSDSKANCRLQSDGVSLQDGLAAMTAILTYPQMSARVCQHQELPWPGVRQVCVCSEDSGVCRSACRTPPGKPDGQQRPICLCTAQVHADGAAAGALVLTGFSCPGGRGMTVPDTRTTDSTGASHKTFFTEAADCRGGSARQAVRPQTVTHTRSTPRVLT